MILSRYILRETVKTQIVLFVILVAIFLCQSFVQILRNATKGDIPVQFISEFLVLSIPNMAILVLPLTIYLAILFTHSRLGSDSEMVVMKSVGITPNRILFDSFKLGIVTAIIALVNSMYFVPKAQVIQESLLEDAKNNSSYFALDSGKFIRVPNRNMVVYFDDVLAAKNTFSKENLSKLKGAKETRTFDGVYLFILDDENSKNPEIVSYAKDGFIKQDEEGIMWFVMQNGMTYIGPSKDEQYSTLAFDDYHIWLSDSKEEAKQLKISSVSTSSLIDIDTPAAIAEFQWRINVALAIPILTLIIVPLSTVKPRSGRFARLFPAILIYGSYFLFLAAMRNMIETQTIGAFPGLYIVPTVYMLLFAIPCNLVETKWYKAYQLNKIRKTQRVK